MGVGRDQTLHAECNGVVAFRKDYDRNRTYVDVHLTGDEGRLAADPGLFLLRNVALPAPSKARSDTQQQHATAR